MKTILNEDVAPFDVDETLVLHNPPEGDYTYVYVTDPLHSFIQIRLAIHQPMVRLLKEAHNRGSFVIVWSRGGYNWAKNVINALELEPYVNLIMSKPRAYYDDMPVEKWLLDRVYIEPNKNYKRSIKTKQKETKWDLKK